MNIKLTTTFDTLAHRVIYGLNLMYSDFVPIQSNIANEQSQRKLHEFMKLIINKLYENPMLLDLTDYKDEAYQSYEVNNMKPELDKKYQSVYRALFEFYKCLYIASLHGEINQNCLMIDNALLKENKAAYKPQYKVLLNEVGLDVIKSKTGISISSVIGDDTLLHSLKLLAMQVPVDINKWTPFLLANFACCSFSNDFHYLLQRTDSLNNLSGLLSELENRCLENGYTAYFECGFTATGIGYNISFKNSIGGYLIGYNSRKYQQFSFGTIDGIGEKAMLGDFENLDEDLKGHFVSICKACNHCLGCTKGGNNKIFTINVVHNGKEHALCPCFPQHNWDSIDRRLIDLLFKYHTAQEKYGNIPKKK